ncbi:unnamed protein product [Nippostrongylus brasiliensis]|uniref:Secreted protein n=1 Tax=Nippostrongylus brasiliensis TaxID=27835 RepID=A0A0N4XHN8_NIPBR|nr:unnamed protein product [Nippostrongylus brasiliensis]
MTGRSMVIILSLFFIFSAAASLQLFTDLPEIVGELVSDVEEVVDELVTDVAKILPSFTTPAPTTPAE